jgi:hypothetical protein
MAVSRSVERVVAEVWANNKGGVTVRVPKGRVRLSIEEAWLLLDDLAAATSSAVEGVADRAAAEQTLREFGSRLGSAFGWDQDERSAS